MKSFAVGCALLGIVACGNTGGTTAGAVSSTGGVSSSGARTSSGSSGASSTGAASSTSGPTGSSTGAVNGTSTGGSTGTTGGSSAGAGTTTGSYIGLPCTFDTQTGADSCVPFGYQCSLEYDSMDPGTCRLPTELGLCLSGVGCQDGGSPQLACTPGFTNGGKNVDVCLYPCQQTADCLSIDEYCLPGLDVCFLNFCDQNSHGQFVGPFYNECPVGDGGLKGQCLPLDNGAAFCFQTGFDVTNLPCNQAGRTGNDSQCTLGNFCVPNQADDGGLCMPISEDGGCPPGQQSFAYLGGVPWSECFQDCSQGPCNIGTCYNITPTGQQLCLP